MSEHVIRQPTAAELETTHFLCIIKLRLGGYQPNIFLNMDMQYVIFIKRLSADAINVPYQYHV